MDLNRLVPNVYAVIAIVSTFFLWSRHSRRVQRNFERSTSEDGESEASSPPSSSPPVREDGFQYDVFLSFRGPDTRDGFTGFLHYALKEKGITTFIDSENLEKGQKVEELFECIQKSKIFVPIFSKGYADSEWCLKEIAKMVECGRLIIPVFFHVEPRDVRNQTGPFADAFKKWYENNNIDKEEVGTWSAALRKAGEFSGFNFDDKNRDQAKLVQLIVERVLKEVNKTPLPVAKHPIGLDSRIGEVMELLNVDARKEVKIVGIHAMGGMGKTTLAKAVYNQTYTLFDGCSFVKNVREAAKESTGLFSLQEQILRDAFNDEKVKVNNTDDGTGKIKQRILSKKVLLILDDVDDESQVDALTGGADRNQICSGSRIIITTREKKVLTAPRVKENEVYELKGLDATQSLQLFSWHAFGKEEPTDEFAELSEKVVATAAGLPLALEIFGPLFSDLKEVEEWIEMLDKLRKNQNKDIHEKLKISYDVLDEQEKGIFLDIACFFNGKRRKHATLMWDDCQLSPLTTIKTLVRKSLVNINDKTRKFEMHDQIRDMGRKIVQDENPLKPLVCNSRLWMDADEIQNVLQEKRELENVKAIQLFPKDVQDSKFVGVESFTAMSQLRMLQLGRGVGLKGDYGHLPKNLRWLEWHPNDLDSLPDDIHLENIVVLDLSWSSITQLWDQQGPAGTKVFQKLKVLKLFGCEKLTSCPDFASMPHLQELDLSHCREMTELHQSIGRLERLTHLSLQNWCNLEKLPVEIWQLTSLEEFDLSSCRKITALPLQMGDCKSLKQLSLKVLNLKYCENLTTCPDFTRMPHLETLEFDFCKKMSELSPSIGQLKSLTNLSLICCKSLKELPKEIWQLSSLEKLYLSGCITTWPSLSGDSESLKKQLFLGNKLKFLHLVGCLNLTMCPDFTRMPHLETLEFVGCEEMSELSPSIGQLKSLTKLSLMRCKSLKKLPKEIWQLSSLETLDLSGCKGITMWPSLSGDSESLNQLFLGNKLKVLDLYYCEKLTTCPDFTRMPHLKRLVLSGCKLLKGLPGGISQITALTSQLEDSKSLKPLLLDKLEYLDLTGCENLTCCPDFTSMPRLKRLDFGYCVKMIRLHPSIQHLTSLSHLELSGCKSLKELPQLPHSLIKLSAGRCDQLEKIENVSNLKGLEELDLSGCERLVDIPGIQELKCLKRLQLQGCRSLPNSFWKMLQVNELKVLHLGRCENLTTCPDFTRMPLLETLEFDSCEEMSELSPSIGQLKSLTKLSLSECKSLKELPKEIWQLSSLEEFYLKDCENLTACPDFTRMPHLETLEFDRCYKMSELSPSIGKLKSLTNLSLRWCDSLKELPKEIWQLSSLEQLNLIGCKGITMWPSLSGDSESLNQLFLGNKLKFLCLLDCENLTTCPDFTRMPHLEILFLSGCKSLKGLPGGISQITALTSHSKSLKPLFLDKLEYLNLSHCLNLTCCPDFTSMPRLTSLDFADCEKMIRLHTSIQHLTSLSHLNLSCCESLKELPQLPPSLITLNAGYCYQLEKIENVSNLKVLQELNLSVCERLVNIPGIHELKCLERLKLDGCRSLCNSFWEMLQEANFEHLYGFSTSGSLIASEASCQQYLSFLLPKQFDGCCLGLLVDPSSLGSIHSEREESTESEEESIEGEEADGQVWIDITELEESAESQEESIESEEANGQVRIDITEPEESAESKEADDQAWIDSTEPEESTSEEESEKIDVRLWNRDVRIDIMAGDAHNTFSTSVNKWDKRLGIPMATFGSDSELMMWARDTYVDQRKTFMMMRVSIDGCGLLCGDLFSPFSVFDDYYFDVIGHNTVVVQFGERED